MSAQISKAEFVEVEIPVAGPGQLVLSVELFALTVRSPHRQQPGLSAAGDPSAAAALRCAQP